MNILQVTLGFLPAVHWGGPVKIVYQNSRELVRRGHHVTVLCTNLLDKQHKIRPYTFEDEIDGIRVVYFNAWNIPQWPGTLGPIWLPDLKAHFADEIRKYDVVHLNGYRNLMNQQVISLMGASSSPLVIQPHGAMPVIVNSLTIKKIYDHLMGQREIQRAQAFIALQETEKQQIATHGIPAERIEIIPNGLDVEHIPSPIPRNQFRARYGIAEEKKLILFLGRINRKKGVDMLVQAFAMMKNDNTVLVIAGPDDGQLDEARNLVQTYHLERQVVFTGSLADNEVWPAYRDADLFVLPCRTDTFPTTIMEACAMQTPMVITEGCEMADLVRGKAADVVPFDARTFADAMQSLLANKQRYKNYQENCKALMDSVFSIQATVDRLESLYTRLIQQNPLSDER